MIGASAGAAATVLLCAAAGLIVCRRRRLFDDDDDESEHAKQLSLSAGNPSQQLRTTDENLKRIMLGSHASSEPSQLQLGGGSELDDNDATSLAEDLPLFSPTPSERRTSQISHASQDFPHSEASTTHGSSNALAVSKGSRNTSDFNIFRLVKLIRKPSMSPNIVQVNFEKEVTLKRCIGSGGFSNVYHGLWQGRDVAVKMMQGEGASNMDSLYKEVELLARIDHPCIVRLYACCLQAPNVCLLEEYCKGGSLDDLLYGNRLRPHRKARRLEYSDILHIATDVSAAMAYLHPSIVHRDLKPSNVLLTKAHAKIADFGVSRWKDNTFLSATSGCGTVTYTAPEILCNELVNEKADVYSFGVLLWECLTVQRPWKQHTIPVHVILAVAVKKQTLPLHPEWPRKLTQLLTACLSHDPRLRPSFLELLQLLAIVRQELQGLGLLHTVPQRFDDVESQPAEYGEYNANDSSAFLSDTSAAPSSRV